MPKGRDIPYSEAELVWIEAHATWPRRKAHAEFCQRFGRDDVSLENFRALCARRGWLTDRRREPPYSETELVWIEAHRMWPRRKVHAEFCHRFGRDDVSLRNFRALCVRRGWRMGYRPRIPYSEAELAWIEAHATWPRRKAHAEFCRRFGRDDVNLVNFEALCVRRGWRTGRTGCYEPGETPWNRGRKMPFNANSARTRFRKGQQSHNTKYLGHERLDRDGYVMISVGETNPHTGYERRYVEKHRHLWEQVNGPVPEGHCLKCRDGDKTNTDPANWIAVPRALLPRLNGRHGRDYDTAPAELKPLILATARLAQKAFEARRDGAKRSGKDAP